MKTCEREAGTALLGLQAGQEQVRADRGKVGRRQREWWSGASCAVSTE